MLLHTAAAIFLYLSVAFSFIALRDILSYTMTRKPNKYPLWMVAAGICWAGFYLCSL
jgi:hypothetical protein